MPRLVLINGAPGSGKSTLAHRLAQDEPLALALDVDTLKHSLGGWDRDPIEAGLRARDLAIAVAGENLRRGSSVIVAQYLAQTTFSNSSRRSPRAWPPTSWRSRSSWTRPRWPPDSPAGPRPRTGPSTT